MDRRQAMKMLGGAIAAPAVLRGRFPLFAGETYSTRCVDLMRRALVIDMLSQFKLGGFMDVLDQPGPKPTTWFSHPETFTTADFQRYRSSGIDCFQIGWGYSGRAPFEDAKKILEAWNRFINAHFLQFVRIDSVAHLDAAKRTKRIGILLGFQNSDHFRSLDDVAYFHGLGQRVSQLTYNVRNAIGSGYEERPDQGLSPFGAEMVARMNQVGIAVDLSHCGDRTTLDAINASRKPVMVSHANCRALDPHPRCKTDEEIKELAAHGGVIGISSVRMFVRMSGPATIENVLDHFDHVAKLVGVEYLGVGSDIDLDGYDKLPPVLHRRMLSGYKENAPESGDIPGLNHPQRMFDLTDGLIRRGYSDAQIEAILGGNWRRLLADVWHS